MAEYETVVWHHQLNGHEFEQAPEDGGQGSLACCSLWSCKELDPTEQLNNNNINSKNNNKRLALMPPPKS